MAAYKALMKDSKQRLGLESFVPWNQVREVLTCYVVHGEEIPPPLDHEYVERVVAFTSKMWGQWCVVDFRWGIYRGPSNPCQPTLIQPIDHH